MKSGYGSVGTAFKSLVPAPVPIVRALLLLGQFLKKGSSSTASGQAGCQIGKAGSQIGKQGCYPFQNQ